ncbi:hypothetical protein ACFSQJ_01205 [Croceitalea marina]|uniref:Uncharacterized protein n=1 Tax=Croceitalea marina TaxID=1775166 RepID=A0ABW5MQW0_9FLAO
MIRPVSFLSTILLIFFVPIALTAQQKPLGKAPAKWFSYISPGELTNIIEYEDKLVLESISELSDDKRPNLDTVYIIKRIDEKFLVIEKKSRKGFGLMERTANIANGYIEINAPLEAESISALEEKLKAGVPDWKNLESRRFYTEDRFNALKKAPGLNEITREDLITSLAWREPLGALLKAYVDDNPDRGRYKIYRYMEAFRNKKLIELGYNPYKIVAYNFEEMFSGDEEVIKLLTEEITFD